MSTAVNNRVNNFGSLLKRTIFSEPFFQLVLLNSGLLCRCMSEENTELVEAEVRRSNVMALYSKGLTQGEIAKELGISQPTVCRDLQDMRKQSRKAVEQQVTDEALFEFSRWMAGLDQMARVAWKIADNESATYVSKFRALEFLRDCYNARLHMLIGAHPEGKNAQSHVIDMRNMRHAYEPDFHFRRERN